MKEYLEVVSPHDVARAHTAIETAKAELQEARDAEERSRGKNNRLEHERASLALQHAELVRAQAESKSEVFAVYGKPITVRKLQADVEKAKSVERASEAVLSLEQAKEKHAGQLVGEYGIADKEALVVALLDRAMDRENQVVALIIESQKLAGQTTPDAEAAKDRLEKLEAKRAEAKQRTASATTAILEAVTIAKHVSSDWAKLLEIEQELWKARESVANLEELAAKKK